MFNMRGEYFGVRNRNVVGLTKVGEGCDFVSSSNISITMVKSFTASCEASNILVKFRVNSS